jgi:uncharacterized repeat protein (TIGR03803 family)
MLVNNPSFRLMRVMAIATAILFAASTFAAAQYERVLHSFSNTNTINVAGGPYSGLIFDAAGNLYGTSSAGGVYNDGVVFELTPRADRGWTTKTLHNFDSQNGLDGASPQSTPIFDAAGNLYGTTAFGGTDDVGTVYELVGQPGGGWIQKILYSFLENGIDGYLSLAPLTFDASGNLYGTTVSGGASGGGGIVFELTPQSDGSWVETVLYSFCSQPRCIDGGSPLGGLIFDASGNLFGMTSLGGAHNDGAVFELTPLAGGGWTETVLHNFNSHGFNGHGSDGVNPHAGLIFDATGNLYGTTAEGGSHDWGTVFKLTPQPGGSWKETVLHNFNADGIDGIYPFSSLSFDLSGNLYGTTNEGGTDDVGAAFELKPQAGAEWAEKILHSFEFNGTDGYDPYGGLIVDAAGNVYGTTRSGGTYNEGTAFEITPWGDIVPGSQRRAGR